MSRLEAIRQREQAATKGPWHAWPDEDPWDSEVELALDPAPTDGSLFVPDRDRLICRSGCGRCGGFERHEDREFAAHARADVPLLLAVVEAAAKVVTADPADPIGHCIWCGLQIVGRPRPRAGGGTWPIGHRPDCQWVAATAALAPLLEPEG